MHYPLDCTETVPVGHNLSVLIQFDYLSFKIWKINFTLRMVSVREHPGNFARLQPIQVRGKRGKVAFGYAK